MTHTSEYAFAQFIKRDAVNRAKGRCEVCGGQKDLQVHHIISVWYAIHHFPFLAPYLVSSIENAIVLCPTDHAQADANMENTFRADAARIFGI